MNLTATTIALLCCVSAVYSRNGLVYSSKKHGSIKEARHDENHKQGTNKLRSHELGSERSQKQEFETQGHLKGHGTQGFTTEQLGFHKIQDLGLQPIQLPEFGTQGLQANAFQTQELQSQGILGQGFGSQEFKLPELGTRGVQVQELHSVGFPSYELLLKGYKVPESQQTTGFATNGLQPLEDGLKGFQEVEIQGYKGAGFGSQGYKTQELGTRGYGIKETRPEEYKAQELQVPGFGIQEIGSQVYKTQELQTPDYGTKGLGSQSQGFELQGIKFRPGYRPRGAKRPIWKKPVKLTPPASSWATDNLDISDSDSEDTKDTINEHPKAWVAPQYHHALEDYDAAVKNIQNHFKREAHTYKDDKDFRYTVVAIVVDGLSKIVAERGWDYYDKNYKELVKSLAEKAVVNPLGSVDMIRCVFRHANESIEWVRTLINNPWNAYICKAQPFACDTVIFALLKACPNSSTQLEKQAELLLRLGDAAYTFLNSYASVFDAVTDQNSYQYIMTGKEAVRELVKKNALVRNLLYPNGGPTDEQCSSPYVEFVNTN